MATSSSPRWLHCLAVGTVCAALPLLFLGAEVTTKGVGMADSRSVVSPWQAISEFLQGNQSLGWAIEHSHRLFGWLVGLLGFMVLLGAWIADGRLWVKVLATAGFLMICSQGLLGIFRVQLHAFFGPTLALIHGAFAPLVLATLASVALVTSNSWDRYRASASVRHRNGSLVVAALIFMQMVLGGLVRHQQAGVAARLHLYTAFIVVVGLGWLITSAWDEGEPFRFMPRYLIFLVALQLALGVEAYMGWAVRTIDPAMAIHESNASHMMRSGHYLFGALLFVATVLMAFRAHRGLAVFESCAGFAGRKMEGAA